VAFSPNGRRIVSGSGDNTIRIWDANTGIEMLQPFSGHWDEVRSVAFSLDGYRIASGSKDNTIQIWNAETGCAALEPLRGHSSGVMSYRLA
jgi:WD40 repeat protein